MKPTCIYIYIYIFTLWVLLVFQDHVDCYATGTGRSRSIACHSRDIGNMLLYHYHLENINGGKKKWWPDRDMVWVLVGVRGCVATDGGHRLVTLLSLSMSVKDRPLHKALGKSQTYYPKHILGYGRLEDLLLSCHGFQLFSDRLSWWFLG